MDLMMSCKWTQQMQKHSNININLHHIQVFKNKSNQTVCSVLCGSVALLVSVLPVNLIEDHIHTAVFISCERPVFKLAACNTELPR